MFVISVVFGCMFDFGDMSGSTSDVNKPTVSLHILYGDVFENVFYFDDVFRSMFSLGDVLRSTFVIGYVYGLHINRLNRLPSLKH